jgi:tRNA modification GTPase
MPEKSPESSVAVLLTPPGSAAIAVVRLAGPGVGDFLGLHFSKPAKLGRCVHGELRDGTHVIDDAVVVLVGQNTADLNLHGGIWVVQSVLDLAHRAGFQVAHHAVLPLPPEAVDASSVLEAEVLAHLPMARTELGVRALLAQQHAWDDLRSRPVAVDELRQILADRTLDCLLHPRRVAVVGAANVGKSTLANQLFASERSITADVPGTTRDWVGEIANIDGLPVMLLDTPGLRATDDPIEAEAIGRSGQEVELADATILVIDASRPAGPEQAALVEQFPNAIRVLNKVDKSCGWDADRIGALKTVATLGEGIETLRRKIVLALCGGEPIEIERPRCWTERQRALLHRAIDNPSTLQDL